MDYLDVADALSRDSDRSRLADSERLIAAFIAKDFYMIVSLQERFGEFIMTDEDGRELGAEIRMALESGDDVVLDFMGVRSILSAFMNPAVGDLYKYFDADELDRRIHTVHATDVHEASLHRVREHARKYYNDAAYRAAKEAAFEELFR